MKISSDEPDTKAMSPLIEDPHEGTGRDGMSLPRLCRLTGTGASYFTDGHPFRPRGYGF
jgi:hypothetical protein